MGWGNEEKLEFQEPQNTELDVYQFEINTISNETLESTRNMRRMCEESKDMGQKTMGLLENQGESIENWEEVADKINEDMKMAEKALKDMDRACFGFIPRFWKVGGGFKEDDAVWKEPDQPKNDQLPELKGLNPDHCFVATANESGVQDDREKEMEENMNEVSATIVNLRNMANDIGNVTKAQNEMLNRIEAKNNSDIQRVAMAVKQAAALNS